ncbi:MAG: alpha/beta fold hydrolase [Actinomycetota bacterium]|nr:alpha/beta fold hydrolase [Actinomycetota bacterium]
MRRRPALIAASGIAAVAVLASVAVAATAASPAVRREVLTVPAGASPDGVAVSLDATLFLPAGHRPAPAVVLAHGFGGSKDDETTDALDLARHGYVALAYSARGFGRSGGQITLDAPAYEVRDAQRMVDLLGGRTEVVQDGPGDPRVGFAGGSYGGALSLLAAGYDKRVDAIAPAITWHDLRQSLFPQFASGGGSGQPGVFKRLWAGVFFAAGSAPGPAAPDPSTCGRFAAAVCSAYQASSATGVPTPEILDLLAASSPATVLDRITAPTLLIQGESDSLFPLSEADANARGIAARGTPVKEVWYAGGHDGATASTAALRSQVRDWFGRYLRRDGSRPDTRFGYTELSTDRRADTTQHETLFRAAGATPSSQVPVPLDGPTQTIVSPAGGYPAAVTSLPGLGSALGVVGTSLPDPPGQSARFESAPLSRPLHLVGAPAVDLVVGSDAGDATLFAKLYDVSPDGATALLPRQLVSPIRLADLADLAAGTTRQVHVDLPELVHTFAAGHHLRLVVSSTDQGYQLPATARTYRLGLAGTAAVTVPQVAGQVVGGGGFPVLPVVAAVLLLLVAGVVLLGVCRSRRSAAAAADPGLADIPLVIAGLGKAYGDGFRAVSELSFRVERGQVLGLLGPNGAGKTTTLRMVLGLIHPTEGAVRVFGQPVVPGAPVLSRVGAFVEGPGFLPHLSGRSNLTLFWRATGRPAADAHLDDALEIAGLGADVERKVRTYSHGMRQRLAIAQAMLGLPDLLVLDEPTNGLDPPQIREMREVLKRYAGTGRTVVVSSHLLSEVEQTCTDAVVMHHGRLLAQGPVSELVGATTSVVVDVDDPVRAASVAGGLTGVHGVSTTPAGVVLELNGIARGELVRALVAAGVAVDRVAPQRRLEEVFLQLINES